MNEKENKLKGTGKSQKVCASRREIVQVEGGLHRGKKQRKHIGE